jgi:hypothetical protein
MSIINQEYARTYPAQVRNQRQVSDVTTETGERFSQRAGTNVTLILEWSRLLNSAAGTG